MHNQKKPMTTTNTMNATSPFPLTPPAPARLWPLLAVSAALVLGVQMASATANYVYHERSGNNPGCGTVAYVPILYPNSLQNYDLRFKVEYQFYTDSLQVYYTTDGST